MMKPVSPGGASLFASDYSLSPNPSPTLSRGNSPNPSLPTRRGLGPNAVPENIMLQPLAVRPAGFASPLPVVFPSPLTKNFAQSHQSGYPTPPGTPSEERYTRPPATRAMSGRYARKASTVTEVTEEDEEVKEIPILFSQQSRPTSEASKSSVTYTDCESCMQGE
jgi:hypothetical protein